MFLVTDSEIEEYCNDCNVKQVCTTVACENLVTWVIHAGPRKIIEMLDKPCTDHPRAALSFTKVTLRKYCHLCKAQLRKEAGL